MEEYASMKDQSIFIEAMSTIARHCASDYRTSSTVVMQYLVVPLQLFLSHINFIPFLQLQLYHG